MVLGFLGVSSELPGPYKHFLLIMGKTAGWPAFISLWSRLWSESYQKHDSYSLVHLGLTRDAKYLR